MVVNWLKKQALEKPHKLFLNELSFQEVDRRVSDLAGRIYPFVKAEDRVALYAHNSVEMALFFLALQALQIEVFMMNTRLTGEERAKKLKTLNIQVAFSDDDTFIPLARVLAGDYDGQARCREEDAPEKIAVIMDTSATSGDYKSVPLRRKQFAAHVQASRQVLGVREEDNWLLVLPLYHIGGLAILMRSLYNGTRVTLMGKFDEEQILKGIEEGSLTMLSLVPTLLMRIVNRIRRHHLRVVLVSGEFIPKSLVETCLEKGIPIYKSYGMTETTSQCTTFCVAENPGKLDSVGLPLPGVTLRIVNPDGSGIGEVLVQSPLVMDGYLGQEPAGGFINTQDMGYVDEEGYLYILDRRKDILISGGENIYPQEIEQVLYAHPEISECAIVGMKDEKWGQVPVLFVVSSLEDEEIMDYLARKLARYKLPRKIVHLRWLPRNATGKILKKDLAELAYAD
ncbi:2-succinylbenzoate--CoA ligase [bioreactor metagenome]|uniref:2-succinylbenzoate--CoA ligase n=2 Tax=root TaxID=1 RepID=A0A098AWN0_DESHA|nr:o-succinylbenzoate--CoA ligase [Desulfitobacterium hafniense]MEA5023818.1 o-succinylbenzoate--CoA ligase [Desulfitobacterium hafniense]CDX00515.1 2-succinylbenzoate--CoA ligase [Desulfitobacterium hafniense]